jgi:hypothetical protein
MPAASPAVTATRGGFFLIDEDSERFSFEEVFT